MLQEETERRKSLQKRQRTEGTPLFNCDRTSSSVRHALTSPVPDRASSPAQLGSLAHGALPDPLALSSPCLASRPTAVDIRNHSST